MKITVSHTEYSYNYSKRKRENMEITDGFYIVPSEVETALKALAPKYRVSVADMVGLVLAYYFGDGKDHFGCEFCDWEMDGCGFPKTGEQTTIPILDKGMVVVGHLGDELQECEGGENV